MAKKIISFILKLYLFLSCLWKCFLVAMAYTFMSLPGFGMVFFAFLVLIFMMLIFLAKDKNFLQLSLLTLALFIAFFIIIGKGDFLLSSEALITLTADLVVIGIFFWLRPAEEFSTDRAG